MPLSLRTRSFLDLARLPFGEWQLLLEFADLGLHHRKIRLSLLLLFPQGADPRALLGDTSGNDPHGQG